MANNPEAMMNALAHVATCADCQRWLDDAIKEATS
jgi:ribonucleotide reductase alpha subunit